MAAPQGIAPSKKGLLVAFAGLVLAVLPALVDGALWPVWVFFWTLLTLLFGLDVLLAVRAKDLALELTAPPTLYVGGEGHGSLRLAAPTGRTVPAEILLDLSDNLVPEPAKRTALARAGVQIPLPLRARRRGLAVVERAWIRYEGPLGLVVHRVQRELGRRASVVPNMPLVRSHALPFFSQRDHTAGLKIERFAGDGSEFDALREFAPGGDRRNIDWKASARHTKLLAREHRAERSHNVILAVDTGRLMAEPLGGIPRLDHAVHAALLLAYVSAKAGDRVSLFAFDDRPRGYLAPRAGMAAFRALSERTAELEYGTAETNYTLGLTDLLSKLSRRSLVIVLTDFVDTVTAELMVDNIERVAKRHLVVFVALRDPLFAAVADARPESLIDVHRAVVAESLAVDREIVMKRLLRRGVHCIDAPADRVGPSLVSRYLEIKRRELV